MRILGIQRLQKQYFPGAQGHNRLAFDSVGQNPLPVAALGFGAAALAGIAYVNGGDDILDDIFGKTLRLKQPS